MLKKIEKLGIFLARAGLGLFVVLGFASILYAVNVILPKGEGLAWLVVTIPADIIAFGGLLYGVARLFKSKDKKPLSLKETQELLGSEEPVDIGPIPLDPISAKALADEIMRRLENGKR